MKKCPIKPAKIDSMLYQKTNEDFNNEKPDVKDPTQKNVRPLIAEKDLKSNLKTCKK